MNCAAHLVEERIGYRIVTVRAIERQHSDAGDDLGLQVDSSHVSSFDSSPGIRPAVVQHDRNIQWRIRCGFV